MTDTDLLPDDCPFCGSEANVCHLISKNEPTEYGVSCVSCSANKRWYDTESDAITAWNTRTPSSTRANERGDFYNATTEDALEVLEAAFKSLQDRGVKSNYGVTKAALNQIGLNNAVKDSVVDNWDYLLSEISRTNLADNLHDGAMESIDDFIRGKSLGTGRGYLDGAPTRVDLIECIYRYVDPTDIPECFTKIVEYCAKHFNDKQALKHTPQPSPAPDMVAVPRELLITMQKSITGYNAALEMMLDSAHEKTDLTDTGIANLMNASIALGDEALSMLQPYTKGE